MDTYDSTVKLARALVPGDVLVGVGADGERLFRIRQVHREADGVVVVTDEQSVTFEPRDQVRVAHPDVADLYLPRDEADAESPTRTA